MSADTAEISLVAIRSQAAERMLDASLGSPLGTLRLLLYPVNPASAREVLAGRAPKGMEPAPGYPSRFSLDLMAVATHGASPGDVGPFFIMRRADHALVGEIGCRVDPATGTAHVGYTIAEHCQNLGYATEALCALLRHLLDDVGVRRVEGETLAGHLASRRVMEKAGMRLAGRGKRDDVRVSYEAVAGVWSHDPPVLLGRRSRRRQRHRAARRGLRLIS